MSVANDFEHPSTLAFNDEHRIRIMHMLLRVGQRMGQGKDKLSGFVMYCLNGKMYSVTSTDVWCHDYHEFMHGVRSGEIPYTASTSPIY